MVIEDCMRQVTLKGERWSEIIYDKTKPYLPFLARLCLLSHFVQDNIIVAHFTAKILGKLGDLWGEALVFVFLGCFLARAVGVALALQREKVPLACGLLLGSGIVQWIVIGLIFPRISNILVNVSVFGCLFFLLAEEGDSKPSFAGVPTLDEKKPQDYMKLCGRCLLVLMFFNFISLEASFLLILQDILGFSLMILVVLGYKTKLSVLVTIMYLNLFNIYENDWWTINDNPHERMFTLHQFLEGISVTGGLLMLVIHGPGELSLDKVKKDS